MVIKKVLVYMLSILFCMNSLALYNSAESIDYPEHEITVIFQENTTLDDEGKERFVTIITNGITEPHSTYSILCLFGHKEILEYHQVLKHKALSVDPRCANQFYEVITCERCDYMDATLVSQAFISCCPED